MTWFKIDDRMPDNAKIRRAGTAAIGLWSLAGAWSAGNLTDGFVPKSIAKRWDSGGKLAKKLLDSGLWLEAESDGEKGYQFHQWEEWQPAKVDVLARRKAAAERVAKHRANKAARDEPVSNASRNALQDEYVTPPPSRPDPTRKEEETSSSAEPPTSKDHRPDVDALCERLRDRIVENGAKATITTKWRTEARLLLDRDGRDLDKALNLVDWCQADPFWKSNVLSMRTFRAKYDQLRLKALQEHNRSAAKPGMSARERGFVDLELKKNNPNPDVVRLFGPSPTSPELKAIPGGLR